MTISFLIFSFSFSFSFSLSPRPQTAPPEKPKRKTETTSAPSQLFYRLLNPKDVTPKLNGRKVKKRKE